MPSIPCCYTFKTKYEKREIKVYASGQVLLAGSAIDYCPWCRYSFHNYDTDDPYNKPHALGHVTVTELHYLKLLEKLTTCLNVHTIGFDSDEITYLSDLIANMKQNLKDMKK